MKSKLFGKIALFRFESCFFPAHHLFECMRLYNNAFFRRCAFGLDYVRQRKCSEHKNTFMLTEAHTECVFRHCQPEHASQFIWLQFPKNHYDFAFITRLFVADYDFYFRWLCVVAVVFFCCSFCCGPSHKMYWGRDVFTISSTFH